MRGLVVTLVAVAAELGASSPAWASPESATSAPATDVAGTHRLQAELGQPQAFELPAAGRTPSQTQAQIQTDLRCGQLRANLDVASASQAADRVLDTLASDAERYARATPLRILCQLSPATCAHLERLNARIDSEVSFLGANCRALEADLAAFAPPDQQLGRFARRLGQKQCIELGGGGADAVRRCLANPPPATEGGSGGAPGPHPAFGGREPWLAAVLAATPHPLADDPGVTVLVTALAGGDVHIEADGTVVAQPPPGGPLTAADLQQGVLLFAAEVACDPQRRAPATAERAKDPPRAFTGPVDRWSFVRTTAHDAVSTLLQAPDDARLSALPIHTASTLCYGLTRTAARHAAQTLTVELGGLLELAQSHPELPVAGRQRLATAHAALTAAAQGFAADPQIVDYRAWSAAVSTVSDVWKAQRQAMESVLYDAAHVDRLAPKRCWSAASCGGLR